jgi:outer membrane autotransporter protein
MEEWRDTEGALAGTVSLSSLRLMDWSAQPLYAGTGLRSYTPVSTDSVAAPGWSLFASGTGQFGDIQGNGNGTGYDFQTGGMTVGADKSLGKVFDGDLVAGVYAGYAGSEAKLDNAGGRIDANGGKFGVFGSWVKEGLYVNAQTGGGVSDYDTRRNVLGQRQNGNTTGYEFIAESAIGHEWKSGGWRFGPEGALSYSYVGIDRFTENGGLAPLQIQEQNIHSLQTRLGWRTSYELVGQNGWWLRPGINVSWAHEFLSTAESIEARFASGAGGLFTTQPTRVGRDTAIAGANVTFGQGTRWSAWLAYEAEAGDRLLVHTINAGASIKF